MEASFKQDSGQRNSLFRRSHVFFEFKAKIVIPAFLVHFKIEDFGCVLFPLYCLIQSQEKNNASLTFSFIITAICNNSQLTVLLTYCILTIIAVMHGHTIACFSFCSKLNVTINQTKALRERDVVYKIVKTAFYD